MNVLKRDGRTEAFALEKIATSVINAADDVNVRISDKDGLIVAMDVQNLIRRLRGEDGLTSSYEIRGVLNCVLRHFGYHKVFEHYSTEVTTCEPYTL